MTSTFFFLTVYKQSKGTLNGFQGPIAYLKYVLKRNLKCPYKSIFDMKNSHSEWFDVKLFIVEKFIHSYFSATVVLTRAVTFSIQILLFYLLLKMTSEPTHVF